MIYALRTHDDPPRCYVCWQEGLPRPGTDETGTWRIDTADYAYAFATREWAEAIQQRLVFTTVIEPGLWVYGRFVPTVEP